MVERGVLRSFLHNTETARATGQANTGHAARDYSSTLGVGPSNFYLEPGTGVTFAEGVVVTDLMGLHAGADPISGDVSVQALGLLVAGGEVAHPVEDFTVSGELLGFLERVVGVATGSSGRFTEPPSARPPSRSPTSRLPALSDPSTVGQGTPGVPDGPTGVPTTTSKGWSAAEYKLDELGRSSASLPTLHQARQ